MSLSARLEKLKSEIPGCVSVVFGDLETQTVLRVAAVPGLRQEAHDRALQEAQRLLGGLGAQLLAEADAATSEAGADASPGPVEALAWDDRGLRMMQRGGDLGQDALILTLVAAEPSSGSASPSDRVAQVGEAGTGRPSSETLRAASRASRAILQGDD